MDLRSLALSLADRLREVEEFESVVLLGQIRSHLEEAHRVVDDLWAMPDEPVPAAPAASPGPARAWAWSLESETEARLHGGEGATDPRSGIYAEDELRMAIEWVKSHPEMFSSEREREDRIEMYSKGLEILRRTPGDSGEA